MGRIKKIYVLHHSHTDIGYTEQQQQIRAWHIDFIKQALEYTKQDPDFRWNCEGFWAVERYLQAIHKDEREDFFNAVNKHLIDISASYLNFNELIDEYTLNSLVERAVTTAKKYGFELDSAMTADINGVGWGFAKVLTDNNVRNYFACVHTHHGMWPVNRKQYPFKWIAPNGKELLVWNGEHYHFGNELGLAPKAGSSYTIKDDCDAHTIYYDYWKMAETRIPRYLKLLENEQYEFDFVPVMVSGLRTDNSPPSLEISQMIKRWNKEHSDICEIEMTTLSEFFNRVRISEVSIPVYKGDWPDWWSDGYNSDPDGVKLFRDAQRTFELARTMGECPHSYSEVVLNNLALYSEHTFSHCDSMSRPWCNEVKNIASRKRCFAVTAHEHAHMLLRHKMEDLGHTNLTYGRQPNFKIVNPFDCITTKQYRLFIGWYEWNELELNNGAKVVNSLTGEAIESQMQYVPCGVEYVVNMNLNHQEELDIKLIPDNTMPIRFFDSFIHRGTDQSIEDIETDVNQIENDYFVLKWEQDKGITSLFSKEYSRELITGEFAAFTPVYEITPVNDKRDICSVRSQMGRNRKGFNVKRSIGELVNVKRLNDGVLWNDIELNYECNGMEFYKLELRLWKCIPKIDVKAIFHKKSVWEPENLYIALPFTTGKNEQLWIDKCGSILRPMKDQIPGTLTDFYTVQSGFRLQSKQFGLSISMPDTPILQLGILTYQRRKLSTDEAIPQKGHQLSWVMSNYWETNFNASLAGFYEFNYSIELNNYNPEASFNKLRRDSLESITLRLK